MPSAIQGRIYYKQDTRTNLNANIRTNSLVFDLDNDIILYSPSATGYLEFYPGQTVLNVSSTSLSVLSTSSRNVSVDLSATGVVPGSYGSSTQIPQIIVDSFGRIVSASVITISGGSGTSGTGTVTSVGVSSTTLTISNNPITSSGNIIINLSAVGVAGIYQKLVVDAFGRVVSGSYLTSGDIPVLPYDATSASIFWSRISGTPTTLIGFGITSADTLFDKKYLSAVSTNYGSVSSVGIASTTLNVGSSPITTSGNISVNLSAIGTSGVFPKVLIDTFGRVVSGTTLISADIPILPYISNTLYGAANGVTPLDSTAKVPASFLPTSVFGQLHYLGIWNASSGTNISPASAVSGGYYVVQVSGNSIPNGGLSLASLTLISATSAFEPYFSVGDWIISNGTTWDKIDNVDSIVTWNGRGGVVIPLSGDYAATQINTTPIGSITATNVQSALQNLDTNKLASSALFGFTSLYLPLSGGTLTGNISGQNISGTHFGAHFGNLSGTSTQANQLTTPQNFGIIGDVSAVNISFNGTSGVVLNSVLPATGVVSGIYGNSTTVSQFQVDSKGRIISASNVAIQFPGGSGGGSVSSVGIASTTLNVGSSPITTSGNISVNLSAIGTSGVYVKVQTDTYGRVISGTTLVSADIPSLPYISAIGTLSWSQISGTPITLSGYGIVSGDTLFNNKYAQISAIPSLSGLSLYLPLSGGSLTGNLSGQNISGTHFGNLSGTANQSNQLTIPQNFGITGDVSAANISFNGTSSVTFNSVLSATGVTPGIFGNGTNVSQFQVDSKGRIISASNVAIQFPGGSGGSVSSVGVSSTTLTVGLSPVITSGNISVNLSATGVTPGSYGTTTQIPVLNIDSFGRILNASFVNISGAGSSGTGTVTSVGLTSTTLTIAGSPVTSSGVLTANLSPFGTSGTFTKISSDPYGRVISGTTLTSGDIPVLPYISAIGTLPWSQISGTPTTLSGYGIVSGDVLFNNKYAQISAIPSLSGLSLYLPLSGGTLTGPLTGTNISANNISGTHFGNLSGTANQSNQLTISQNFNIVGDVSAANISFNGTSSVTLNSVLSATGVISGIYGNNITVSQFQVDSKGRIISASNVAIQFPGGSGGGSVSSVGVASTTLSVGGSPITTSGNIFVNLSLFGTSGTYTKISSDPYGRVISGTTLTSGDIPVLPYLSAIGTLPWSQISGTPITLSGYGIVSADALFNNKYAQISALPNISLYLPLSGGTLTGPLTGTNISATNISGTHFGNISGTSLQSLTANQLTTPQNFGIVGDIVASNISFNGTGSVILSSTLSAVGTSGIYTKVQTDSKGRVISGTTLTSGDIPVLPYLSVIPSLNYGSVSSVGISSTTLTIGLTPVTTSGNISVNLSPVGTSGVYTKIQSDTFGRVISGATLIVSDIPSLSTLYISTTLSGTANGVAPLDSTAKVPTSFLPSSVFGQVHYLGTWNASSGTTLPAASAVSGGYYITQISGSSIPTGGFSSATSIIISADSFAGLPYFQVGDWIVSNGITWDKIDNTDSIYTWNGRNGSVFPVSGDYSATQINFTPSGSITATNVQTALQNLDANKLASSALFGFTSAYLPLSGGALTGSISVPNISASNFYEGGQLLVNRYVTVSGDIMTGGLVSPFVSATNISGTHFGNLSGTANQANQLTISQNFNIVGDVSSANISFNGTGGVSLVSVLSATGVSSGIYGNNISVSQFQVDAKGRIISASNVAIQFPGGSGGGSVSSVGIASTTLTISNTPITTSGNILVNLSPFGTSGTFPKISTDPFGRVISGTTLTSGDIPSLPYISAIGTLPWSQISGTPTTLSGYGITSSDTLFNNKYVQISAIPSLSGLSLYLPLSGGTLSTPGNLNISGTTIFAGLLYLTPPITTTASTSGYIQIDSQGKLFANTGLTDHKTYTTSAIISATSYLLSATHNLNYQYVNVFMFDFTNNVEILPDVKYNLSTNNVVVINIVNGNQFNSNIIVQS